MNWLERLNLIIMNDDFIKIVRETDISNIKHLNRTTIFPSKKVNDVIHGYEYYIEKEAEYDSDGNLIPATYGIRETIKLQEPEMVHIPRTKDLRDVVKEARTDAIIQLLKDLPPEIKRQVKESF